MLVTPGLLLAVAAGIRGWSALGAAPVFTSALFLVAMLVSSVTGLRWTPANAAWATAPVILLVLLVLIVGRRRRGGPPPVEGGGSSSEDLAWSLATAAGLVLATGIAWWTVVGGTDGLQDPNQGFDALFHVNAVQVITSTGEVHPAVTGEVNGYLAGTSSYPDAFHALASLVAQLGGGTVPAINALVACIVLIAGLGLVALLRCVGLVREAVFAPAILAATTGYPTDLIWRGPIWVFAFGIAVVPSFLAVLLIAVDRRRPLLTLLLGGSAAGLALIHPSAALSAGIFAVSFVAARWWADRSRVARDLVVLVPAGVLAAAVILPLIGQAVLNTGGGTAVDWPVAQTPGEAIGELLSYNYENSFPQVWLAVPALIGLVVGLRRAAMRWWLVGGLAFVGLCAMAAAYDNRLTELVTAPWWNDRYRFEGLVFLSLSVAGAIGVVWLGDQLTGVLRAVPGLRERLTRTAGGPRDRGPVLGAAAALGGLLVLGVLTDGFYVSQNQSHLDRAYGYGVGGSVSEADLPAFRELRRLAGDGPVLNDPNDGSAWMWTLAGVRPVFGAATSLPLAPTMPAARRLVLEGLNCLDHDADVRDAVEELGVRYVYSSEETITVWPTPIIGFRDLGGVESLVPVYQRDGATIYRIDLSPLGDVDGSETCSRD
ncbi:hypothetical protein SAMN05660350_03702 [Geodermatophilus obscurus]|uniref:Uncharacterized protein n=1 Tax=Geodermatophilus obscurus TaxID=1861 RepID=A0A1M7UQ50_9ACTN|nr:hypothetical protein SAMN05660350_03702 [Geodermatophilus obscurus]